MSVLVAKSIGQLASLCFPFVCLAHREMSRITDILLLCRLYLSPTG